MIAPDRPGAFRLPEGAVLRLVATGETGPLPSPLFPVCFPGLASPALPFRTEGSPAWLWYYGIVMADSRPEAQKPLRAASCKVTYSLDEATVDAVNRLSRQADRPKSAVVREAVRFYGEEIRRREAADRSQRLRRFDELMARIPQRSAREVDAELKEIRRERRHWDRRTAPIGE